MEEKKLYNARVFTKDTWPEDTMEWFVGVFDDEDLAKQNAEIAKVQIAEDYLFSEVELGVSVWFAILNKNYLMKEETENA